MLLLDNGICGNTTTSPHSNSVEAHIILIVGAWSWLCCWIKQDSWDFFYHSSQTPLATYLGPRKPRVETFGNARILGIEKETTTQKCYPIRFIDAERLDSWQQISHKYLTSCTMPTFFQRLKKWKMVVLFMPPLKYWARRTVLERQCFVHLLLL